MRRFGAGKHQAVGINADDMHSAIQKIIPGSFPMRRALLIRLRFMKGFRIVRVCLTAMYSPANSILNAVLRKDCKYIEIGPKGIGGYQQLVKLIKVRK